MKIEIISNYKFTNILFLEVKLYLLIMQHKELDDLTQRYIRKLPFIKALIFSELSESVEVFKYVAEDINFKLGGSKLENYLNGLRAAMNSMYTDLKS